MSNNYHVTTIAILAMKLLPKWYYFYDLTFKIYAIQNYPPFPSIYARNIYDSFSAG